MELSVGLEVESLEHIYTGNMKFPMVCVYGKDTQDFPGVYVARLFDADKPTNVLILADTLEELNAKITKSWPGITKTPTFIKRMEGDDPCIIGTWL